MGHFLSFSGSCAASGGQAGRSAPSRPRTSESQRRGRPRRPLPLGLLGAALLLAGCGSSSKPQTTTAPPRASASWQVVSSKTVPGRGPAVIGGDLETPVAIEVKVAAHPRVSSQIDYSIDCEKSGTHPVSGTLAARRTPLTASIPVTPNAASCFVDVTASKSAVAALTITLLIRHGAGP